MERNGIADVFRQKQNRWSFEIIFNVLLDFLRTRRYAVFAKFYE